MLIIKNVTLKNFLSVGNVSQTIKFAEDDLVLVLGENMDLGGDGNRNGVGKSTILNALSYALYGDALVKIRKDNLVNKINIKGMMVCLDFEKNGVNYRIERGRKPGIFRFIINGHELEDDDTNEAQGDNRLTQQEIEKTIEISHDMFKQIVALNTYSEPFLSQRSADQRTIIEQLLGITKLSEKAAKLSEQLKVIKDEIKSEDLKVQATKAANATVQKNISSFEIKSKAWEKTKVTNVNSFISAIAELSDLDVDKELAKHEANAQRQILSTEINTLTQKQLLSEREIKLYNKNLKLIQANLSTTEDSKLCPTCGSDMDKETHKKVHQEYEEQKVEVEAKIAEATEKVKSYEIEINNLPKLTEDDKTAYSDISDAYNHKSTLLELENNLTRESATENPYTEQIETLKRDGIRPINDEYMEELNKMKEHQEFLYKLLVNKDSFIRKKIIDQNLLYLNNRLSHFTCKLGLPHEVIFQSDLEVEITMYGKSYDFDNLSRGERTRLILSLSCAFRDVYESLNDKINLLFIDELLDNGLDTVGVEAALGVLKSTIREQKRNVFLISHREELIGRVSSILKVVKESGFTSFDCTDTNT